MWASGAVDVRDVADTHLRALDLTESFGQRVPVNERWMWFRDMAEAIKSTVPACRIVTRVASDLVIRILGMSDPSIATIRHDLGKRYDISSDRTRELLGIAFRDTRQNVAESAPWLIEPGQA
jgi:dihydroflavonol-4-reductase